MKIKQVFFAGLGLLLMTLSAVLMIYAVIEMFTILPIWAIIVLTLIGAACIIHFMFIKEVGE